MRVVRISEVQEEPMPTNISPVPGWTGGAVTRTGQQILPPGMSEHFNCGWRNFSRGARENFHIPRRWPWEEQFSRALARLQAIPLPA